MKRRTTRDVTAGPCDLRLDLPHLASPEILIFLARNSANWSQNLLSSPQSSSLKRRAPRGGNSKVSDLDCGYLLSARSFSSIGRSTQDIDTKTPTLVLELYARCHARNALPLWTPESPLKTFSPCDSHKLIAHVEPTSTQSRIIQRHTHRSPMMPIILPNNRLTL